MKDTRAAAPRRPKSFLGQVTWHLHHPLVALGCIAFLVVSVRGLPHGWDVEWDARIAKRLAGRPLPQEGDPASGSVYVLRTRHQGGFDMRLIDTEVESWDFASRMTQERPQDLIICTYIAAISRRGMWYPSSEIVRRTAHLSFFVEPADFTPEELAKARSMFVDWLRKSPARAAAAPIVERIGEGEEIVFRRHMPYVWWNVATLGALGLLFLSLAGTPRYLRVWAANRRVRRGRCGVCRYDLSNTQAVDGEVRCPECGLVWTSRELRRGSNQARQPNSA